MTRQNFLRRGVMLLCLLGLGGLCSLARAQAVVGEVSGSAWRHNEDSLRRVVSQANVALPPSVTRDGQTFFGKFGELPATSGTKVPVVIVLHGSSGLTPPAIREWQLWLASLGIASVAPDSFALNDRVTYKSPVDKMTYEHIHALRLSEIAPTLNAVLARPWANPTQLILAGMSEGAVAVARYPGREFAARMVYSWSCENNYFVEAPLNAFRSGEPVLNVMSQVDPYFSRTNTWLGNETARGHCGAALHGNPQASVLLIPDAPHTLINLPAARDATAGFLQRVLR